MYPNSVLWPISIEWIGIKKSTLWPSPGPKVTTYQISCWSVQLLQSLIVTQKRTHTFAFIILVTIDKTTIKKIYSLFIDEPSKDPCNPSPCGPNSVCRVVEGHAVCSCQSSMIGSPPSCRPECVVSAECPLTQACLMSKCRDPCPGTCGHLANCKVVNHSPICTCPPHHIGDPFRSCYPGNNIIKCSSSKLV